MLSPDLVLLVYLFSRNYSRAKTRRVLRPIRVCAGGAYGPHRIGGFAGRPGAGITRGHYQRLPRIPIGTAPPLGNAFPELPEAPTKELAKHANSAEHSAR